MKIKDYVIILILFIMPLSVLFIPNIVEAGSGWKNAQGYKVTILEYDGKGNKKNLVSILLYTDEMIQTVKDYPVGRGDVPDTFDNFVTKSYNVRQMIDPNGKNVASLAKRSTDSSGKTKEYDKALERLPGMYSNPNTKTISRTDVFGDSVISAKEAETVQTDRVYFEFDYAGRIYRNERTRVKKANRDTGISNWNDVKFDYMTDAFKVTYPSSMIKYDGFAHRYLENGVSPSTIDGLIQEKYVKNQAAIKKYFGVSLDASKIDQYYIAVEPVERYLSQNRGEFQVTGTYFIKSVSKQVHPRTQWVISGGCSGDNICETWKKEVNNTCACGVKKCTLWNGYKSCTNKSDSSYNYRNCKIQNCNGDWYCEKGKKNAKDCHNCDCDTWKLRAIASGERIIHSFYGRKANAPSYIVVVSSGAKLGRAENNCDRKLSMHCERVEIEARVNGNMATFVKKRYSNNEPLQNDGDEIISVCRTTDAAGNERFATKYKKNEEKSSMTDDWEPYNESLKVAKYQYYIGPNAKEALVGTTKSNPYKLVGDCASGGKKGIRHYYPKDFPAFNCSSVCGHISDKSSDDFLKCAENYCDAEVDYNLSSNVRVRKRNCIIACGYNKQSTTNCKGSNPYKGQDNNVNATSTCNISDGQDVSEKKASVVTCDGDTITDFDKNDTNDPRFDGRRYISVACREDSSFKYTDISGKEYTPGEAIDYTIEQTGKKECQAFFDYEQWKFDYATISSKDPDRRKRLKYIYTVYNNQLKNDYNVTKNSNYDKDFADQKDGEINWSNYKYDINKTSVIGKVTEIITNTEKSSGTINMDRTNLKDNASQEVIKNTEKIKLIANNSVKTEEINRYLSTSVVTAEYKFKKACVKTDGTGEAENNTTKEVCYTTKNGTETTTVYPKRVYYTSISATPNRLFSEDIKKAKKGHKVESEISVGKTGTTGDKYYEGKEACSYKISRPEIPNIGRDLTLANCFIDIKENTGTTLVGNNVYVGGSVTAELRYEGKFKKGVTVTGKSLTVNGKTVNSGSTTVSISNSRNSVEDFKIKGTIKLSDGSTYECRGDANIHLLKHTNCGMSCSIDKESDTLHVIRNTGVTAEFVRESTTDDMTRKNVKKSVVTGKHEVRTTQKVTTEIRNGKRILFGYVGNSSCNNYCEREIDSCAEGACPAVENCETKFKPGQIGEITRYCNASYTTDINNYKSPEECILKCTKNACPDNCTIESEIDTYCGNQANVNKAGFKTKQECMNVCICTEKGNYLYRTVSNLDPFPQSKVSPQYKGERTIGKNWYGFSEYITNDSKDESTVTGDNKNRKVEYIIDMSPEDIKKVRKSNEKAGVAGYTSYIYSVKYNKQYKSAYKSKFIHDEYSELFKNGIKANGTYLEAEQDTK